jgi:SHS2 domain-containing protein
MYYECINCHRVLRSNNKLVADLRSSEDLLTVDRCDECGVLNTIRVKYETEDPNEYDVATFLYGTSGRWMQMDHTADLKVVAIGKTLDELFLNSILGSLDCAIEGVDKYVLDGKIGLVLNLEANTLNELLFLVLAHVMYSLGTYVVEIPLSVRVEAGKNEGGNDKFLCKIEAFGIGIENYEVRTEVKNVTKHDLHVWASPGGVMSYSTFILDV